MQTMEMELITDQVQGEAGPVELNFGGMAPMESLEPMMMSGFITEGMEATEHPFITLTVEMESI